MQSQGIKELFLLATSRQRAGRLDEAASAYRKILSQNPRHAESCQMLGLLEHQQGRFDEAIEWLRKAVDLRPREAGFLGMFGAVLAEQGRTAEALDAFQRAVSLQPNDAEIRYNYGKTLKQLGSVDDAIAAFETALRIRPNLRQAYNNLGNALQEKGHFADAIAVYRRAIANGFDTADIQYNLAIALQKSGQSNSAIDAFRRAITLKPAYPEAFNNLGLTLYATGRLPEAIEAYRQALKLTASPEIYSNLGTALRDNDQLDEAIAAYGAAMELRPNTATVLCNFGVALNDVGAVDQALATFRKAIALGTDPRAWDNYLFTLHFDPSSTPRSIWEEHARWNQAIERPPALPQQVAEPSPTRKLRIGYVSPDFRSHSQSFFTLPLLSHHDHQAFEIYCYSDVSVPDQLSQRLQKHADVWRNIAGYEDERVARLIREDRIDILVDLTMHMAGNRLAVFATKAAPLQVTWLAYPGTTGLKSIDYRISDPYLDPDPSNESIYSERTIRPGPSFWCYDPLAQDPPVNPLPALGNGFITFGCLNSFLKVNLPTLDLWARVMSTVPNSRLMLLAPRAMVRNSVSGYFASRGIQGERIQLIERRPRAEYLRLYHEIDLCLDTIPYPGHTTSLDSLWMGVPVVTMTGSTCVSRGGLSILSNAGLPDLVADSADRFVAIASDLAGNLPRLTALRAELRQTMIHSPLMDAPAFARQMESAYRRMWQESRM